MFLVCDSIYSASPVLPAEKTCLRTVDQTFALTSDGVVSYYLFAKLS